MQWYHILGIYLTVVLGLIIFVLIQASLTRRNSYGRLSDSGGRKYSVWVKVWRWLRFVARCGRRRNRRKPKSGANNEDDDLQEERRALRKQLREEAEEWLLHWVEKIVELGEDWLDTDFGDDEEDEDEYLFYGEEISEGGEADDNDECGYNSNKGAAAAGLVDERQVVNGLVNTGNSCFFNSVLQALASADYLQNYLSNILERMDEMNDMYGNNFVSMPLTEALWETLTDLNAVVNQDSASQPYEILAALGTRGLNYREQQDAHEAFKFISTFLTEERQVFADLQTPSLLDSNIASMLAQIDKDKPHIFSVPRGLESVGTKGLARVRAIMKLANFAGLPADGQSLTFGRQPVIHNPFTGLSATRLSCAQCGYTEAVRHGIFDYVTLILPLDATTYTLDKALRDYISLEELSGVQCCKCSLRKTLNDIIGDIKRAASWLESNPKYKIEPDTNSGNASQRRLRRVEKAQTVWRRVVLNHAEQTGGMDSDTDYESSDNDDLYSDTEQELVYPLDPAKQRIDRSHNLPSPTLANVPQIIEKLRHNANEVAKALRANIQSPLPGITLSKAYSPLSTMQVTFAKLPPCLCLHMSRSSYTLDDGAVKNPCHVRFPEYLDLSPYTTNGYLKTDPTESMIDESLRATTDLSVDQINNGDNPYPNTNRRTKDAADALGPSSSIFQTGYRLKAVVVHVGSHSYGHFITYRRKPRPPIRSGVNTPRYRSISAVSLPSHASSKLQNHAGSNGLANDRRFASATPGTPNETTTAAADGVRRRRIVGGNPAAYSDSNSESAGVSSAGPDYFMPAVSQSSTPSLFPTPSRSKRSWKATDAMTSEWYLISDEDVQPATLTEVLNANPYLLIYERIESPHMVEYAGTPGILPSLSNLRNLAKKSSTSAAGSSSSQPPSTPKPSSPPLDKKGSEQRRISRSCEPGFTGDVDADVAAANVEHATRLAAATAFAN